MKRVLIVLLISLCQAMAETKAEISPVQQIQDYLNGITALVADFVQTNPDGDKVQGKIWLKRGGAQGGAGSGKVRIDYEERIPQRIIALKNNLYVYDLTSHEKPEPQDIGNMPAAFILRDKIDLKKDASFDPPLKSADGKLLSLRLTSPVPLTLMFSLYETGNIKGLAGWVLEDSSGLVSIEFLSMQDNDSKLVPDSLFIAP